MFKIKEICVCAIMIGSLLNPITFSSAEATSFSQSQQRAINQINDTLDELEEYGDKMKSEYQREQMDFDMAMAKSKADAIQNKKALDEKFGRMREEFNQKSPKLAQQEEHQIKIDPKIFENKLDSDFSFDMDMDRNNDGSLSNIRVGTNDDRDDAVTVQPQKVKNKQRASLVVDDEDKDYNNALNRVAGESKIEDDSTKATTNIFNQSTPVKSTFTKENFTKFAIAVIFVFIVMAVLFFLGKKKN